MSTDRDPIGALMAFGFTELEATVYAYLVESSPATGYRVSHDIGKPIANTYKAIESLHQKGAVMVDESGDNRLIRAAPPEDLLRQLAQTFGERYKAATEALKGLEPADQDVGIYTVTHAEQVFSRAVGMLRRAEKVVLADLFPEALSRLGEELAATAARGLTVVVRIYEPSTLDGLDGVETVMSARGSQLLEQFPGQWLNMVVDANEFLISFLTDDAEGVHQAVWSNSPFISWVYHVAFSWELTGARVESALEDEDVSLEEIRRLIAEFERIETPEAARGYRAVTGPPGSRERLPIADFLSRSEAPADR